MPVSQTPSATPSESGEIVQREAETQSQLPSANTSEAGDQPDYAAINNFKSEPQSQLQQPDPSAMAPTQDWSSSQDWGSSQVATEPAPATQPSGWDSAKQPNDLLEFGGAATNTPAWDNPGATANNSSELSNPAVNGNDNATNQPYDQGQQEPTEEKKPQEPVITAIPRADRVDITHQNGPRLAAAFNINNKFYGLPSQASLVGNDSTKLATMRMQVLYNEDSMPAEICLSYTARRETDSVKRQPHKKVNPKGEQFHHVNLTFNSHDIEEYSIHAEDSFPGGVAKFFNYDKLDVKNKAVIAFTAKKPNLSGAVIPKLLKEDVKTELDRLVYDLHKATTNKSNICIVALINWTEQDKKLYTGLNKKLKPDWADPPLPKWIFNSPTKQFLQIQNILPPNRRPELSKSGLILRPRLQWWNPMSMKIEAVYGYFTDHQYYKGAFEEWSQDKFHVSFHKIPQQIFKDNPNDNLEDKLILCAPIGRESQRRSLL